MIFILLAACWLEWGECGRGRMCRCSEFTQSPGPASTALCTRMSSLALCRLNFNRLGDLPYLRSLQIQFSADVVCTRLSC
ncbi:hypothetical protein L211DRAFT_18441 [Terfezia boudieri ATCC MYA-4762]|uniref:Uncharacterized protein n=1 Tax=Terfezia boudieri ATCC MYA-4762 TaxID=1051890 RepID=A0A3N4M6R6_9PEZI|nr:hypothetical protein L211DRAFT_18441 [Terfezia boudieri ATCC MYA-4762]